MSQAVSGEIDRDRLIEKLLVAQFIAEHASENRKRNLALNVP